MIEPQAKAIFQDIVQYLSSISNSSSSSNNNSGGGSNRAMSLGVITLNRPQRALIQCFVESAKHHLGLVNLSDRSAAHAAADGGGLTGYIRCEATRHAMDQVLFIQSIDQIQGEERDVILFSTLIAPKTPTPTPTVTATVTATAVPTLNIPGENASQSSNSHVPTPPGADTGAGERASVGVGVVDTLDDLEEATTTDVSGASSNGNNSNSGVGVGSSGVGVGSSVSSGGGVGRASYSTLAHGHGDRLLNVGLTRAVRLMRV